ncbi:MAG: DUF302 domain-containing protein [candidate division Zixibacteria bacterium]
MFDKAQLADRMETELPFETVAPTIEEKTAEAGFRVLAVHDVQETLAEKGFKRESLKIIEVCNAGFAHEALGKDVDVAMFMPCKFVVYSENGKTRVTLARPTMIAGMLPDANLGELAEKVEKTLKQVMADSV